MKSLKYKALMIGLIGCSFLVLYLSLTSESIIIEDRTNLATNPLSNQDLVDIIKTHDNCFEKEREDKLLAYMKWRKPIQSALEESLYKKRIATILNKNRLNAKEAFRNIKGLYLVHLKKGVGPLSSITKNIGLFNCTLDSRYTENSVLLTNVCLHSKYRGKGYGQQMMKFAIENCKKPHRPFVLTVYKSENKVIDMYESLGFKKKQPDIDQGDGFDFFDKFFMEYTTKP